MNRKPAPGPATVCPGEAKLNAFLRQSLPGSILEEIAGHLARCSSCADRLRTLEEQDTLVASLRRPALLVQYSEEPECLDLAVRAKGFEETPLSDDAWATVPATRPEPPELGPFQAPQQLRNYRLLE